MKAQQLLLASDFAENAHCVKHGQQEAASDVPPCLIAWKRSLRHLQAV
jgi:hypothetical protein